MLIGELWMLFCGEERVLAGRKRVMSKHNQALVVITLLEIRSEFT
jgi:hypothetical protein